MAMQTQCKTIEDVVYAGLKLMVMPYEGKPSDDFEQNELRIILQNGCHFIEQNTSLTGCHQQNMQHIIMFYAPTCKQWR